jgi:hypothetical protein
MQSIQLVIDTHTLFLMILLIESLNRIRLYGQSRDLAAFSRNAASMGASTVAPVLHPDNCVVGAA